MNIKLFGTPTGLKSLSIIEFSTSTQQTLQIWT